MEENTDRLDEILREAEAEAAAETETETETKDEESREDYGAPMPEEDEIARAMVGMGWEFIESTISAKYPEVTIKAGTGEKAADSLTPVAIKYGLGSGELPEWIKQFMPEIRAAIFLGGFAWGIAAQVKAAKKEKEEKPRVRVKAGYNFEEVAGAAYGS